MSLAKIAKIAKEEKKQIYFGSLFPALAILARVILPSAGFRQ
jgi:hypothetical protein